MAERGRYFMRQKIYSFTVMFQPVPEGGYDVFVPLLPGCVTQGNTLEEAKAMAKDAIFAYCQSLVKDGEPIPEEDAREGALVGHMSFELQGA